jgi:PAS domain S-box-containing protein
VSLRMGPGAGNGRDVWSEPGRVVGAPVASLRGVEPCAPLELSVSELLALVGASVDWIWETDSELRFTWFSDSYEEVTGLDPQSVIGRRRFDFLKQVAKGSASAAAHLADLDARRPFRNFVYELKGSKPECRWISITGHPRFDAQGTFIGYRGIARNVTSVAASLEELDALQREIAITRVHEKVLADSSVTERTSAERVLDTLDSELDEMQREINRHEGKAPADSPAAGMHAQRMMAALDVMSDAFCYYDRNDRLVLYNQSFVRQFNGLADVIRPGVTYEELLDTGLDRGLWDDEGLSREDRRKRSLALRGTPQWQSTVKTAEGRWIMHRELRTEDGGAMGITTDITELMEKQEQAERANETARMLVSDLERTLDSLRMGVVLLDSSLRVQLVNKAFYDIWSGRQADFAVGSHFRDFMEANRRNGVYEVPDDRWEEYVSTRIAEIRAGDVAPREVARSDDFTMIYSVTSLSGGRRLLCYYDVTEMKRRETDLAAANSKSAELFADLRGMVDAMSIGILVLDADLKTEIINQAFYDLWKVDRPLLAEGAPFRHLMEVSRHIDAHGLESTEWEAHVARREAELRSREHISKQLERSDGRVMICHQAPLPGGKLLVSYVDITELKQRESELAEAKDAVADLFTNLRRMVDAMSVGILVLDRDLKAEIVNKAFYDLWAMAPEKAPEGSSLRQIMEASRGIDVHGADAEAAWQAHVARREEEFRSSEGNSDELTLASGGRIICTMTPLAGGRMLATYVDVTEMKQRETALEEALEKAQLAEAVINDLSDPIFVKDEALQFVLVNKAFSKLFDLSPQEVAGKTAIDFAAEELATGFEATEQHVLDTGRTYEVFEDFEFKGIGRSRIVRKNRVRTESGRNYVAGFLFDVTELKRRENEAEEARKHLANVLESLPASVLVYDSDDRYVFANRKLQQAMPAMQPIWRPGATFREAFELGHSVGYFRSSGNPAVDMLYDTDTERWLDGILAEYHIPYAEFERKNPDGTWQRVFNIRTEDGTFIGVRIDITEIKERERALRDSMGQIDLLRQTLDELPVAVNIKSPELRIEYVNKAWSGVTGITRDEAVGKTDKQLFDLSESDGYTHADAEVSRTGKPIETEEPVVHRDGTQRQLMTRKTRLIASDGSVHLVGSSTDITEVNEREKQLQASLRENEMFRSLIDSVPVAIYAKRPDLTMFYANKGWSDLTGRTSSEALGKTDAEIFGPEGEIFMEGDREVLRTASTQEILEVATWPDGSTRYQIARKSVMTATDGSLYLIGSTTDITELKQREKELEEAQRKAVLADRAKSEFLANMSHEIRTPMNGVLGMAELLAKSELTAKQKMFTDIIVKSGNALLTIINDILDFSKIDAGQLVLDVAPFNLAEAIEDVATLVSTRAKEKDLELIVRVEQACQQIFIGDVGRLRQIITNLLGNAVKFTDHGHVLVDVAGHRQNGHTKLKIKVTDTGIGIPADKLKQVFEKFSQVDSSSTRRHEGTGLGLAITSRLVELMGGEIGVESIEGQGSTFWFTVTLPNAGQPEGRRPLPIDVSGARVLVIDDNAVNRAILSEQMQSWTFDSCAAENGPEGIRVLQAAAAFGVTVDCVVLDFQMPVMTGADVAKVIRSTPGIEHTPIVMLTSVDQTLSGASYRDLGIEAQLIKPARSSALLETLVGTIQKHRAAAGGAQAVLEWHIERAAAQAEAKPVAPVEATVTETIVTRDEPGVEGGHRVDILVAEDNEVNQLVFTQILEESLYTFAIVGNGRLAVEAYGEMKPRMILMDVSMPEMNGIEATAAIRRMEADSGTHLPIVGVTAHALKGDRERCIEAGMDDYLPKPISPKALLEKVEKWVNAGTAAKQRNVG